MIKALRVLFCFGPAFFDAKMRDLTAVCKLGFLSGCQNGRTDNQCGAASELMIISDVN